MYRSHSEATTPHSWNIHPEEAGQRLDRYLATRLQGHSRTAIQQFIAEGAVLVNGKSSKPGYALRVGDEVRVVQLTTSDPAPTIEPQAMPLTIVYEDDDLLVVDKAAGMVVHPAPGHFHDTLVNALLARFPELRALGEEREESEERREQGELAVRPGIVHRLDKDTSGLLVVAKNPQTLAALTEQMRRHEIVKRYLALVEGVVDLDQGGIDAPIGRDPRHRQQMAITATEGREARTYFRVLRRFSHHTLLLLQLETGRTHQIRVHLQAIGHPIVGDPTYGTGKLLPGIPLRRQFLHAYQLAFVHPRTGTRMEFEAPLPEDLQRVLDDESIL